MERLAESSPSNGGYAIWDGGFALATLRAIRKFFFQEAPQRSHPSGSVQVARQYLFPLPHSEWDALERSDARVCPVHWGLAAGSTAASASVCERKYENVSMQSFSSKDQQSHPAVNREFSLSRPAGQRYRGAASRTEPHDEQRRPCSGQAGPDCSGRDTQVPERQQCHGGRLCTVSRLCHRPRFRSDGGALRQWRIVERRVERGSAASADLRAKGESPAAGRR